MSLSIPLAVRLATSRVDRHVTADVRDLSFDWSDPGGYKSCQISLDRPLAIQPDEIAYYGDLTVYDARSGATVWDGRLEDPGRSAGDGQIWNLAGIGGQAHTKDRTVSLIYVDRSTTAWSRIPGTSLFLDTSDSKIDDGTQPGWRMQMQRGSSVPVGSHGGVEYLPISRANQKLARIALTYDMGNSDTNWRLRLLATGGGTTTAMDQGWTTTAASTSRVVVTDWPNGRTTPQLVIARNTSTATISDDVTWALVTGLSVQAMRYAADGTELSSGYTTDYVLAHQVVADLLGRLLTAYDGAGATIATTGYQIQQMAYPDGVDAAAVLDDLLTLEAGYTWRVWERNRAGKYRFEFVPVPSAIRYEADVSDGYDSQGSADGLYNRVTVRWKASDDTVRITERTTDVPILTAAGLTRQGYLDLGSEVGSQAEAERAGDEWLAARRYPPNGGRLRVARPILDLQSGRMVQPWEIGPGLIRVRGVLPRPDALNATSRDGVTIFRIRGGGYRASDAAATLDLDSYPYSVTQSLAALTSSRPRR